MTPPPFNWSIPNWRRPAGRALETLLNRTLALDPDTRDALRTLDGQRVALTLDSTADATAALTLQIRVDGERLAVGPLDDGDAPELSVRSTLGGLLSLLPSILNNDGRRDATPPIGRLRIEGDAELARQLQRLAKRFDPDWQQPFARVFGDVLGVQIANAVAGGLKQARATGRSLAETAAEFVTEESRDVVGRAELDAFHDDVDVLRDDVERIGIRVARLRKALESPAGEGRARAEGPA